MKSDYLYKSMCHSFIKKTFLIIMILTICSSEVFAEGPDCSGVNRWPTKMALAILKNAGIIHNEQIDFNKTNIIRLSSEKIGEDLYRQIHFITFYEKSGNTIKVITSNLASKEECSISDVDVFIISNHLTKSMP